jgi:hypothetical protein
MTTKLHAVVAREKGVRARGWDALMSAKRRFQASAGFNGYHKVYHPDAIEGGEFNPERPDEVKRIEVTVQQVVRGFWPSVVEMIDLVATKDVANGSARGDIVVNGHVVARDVPAVTLLHLEKVVEALRDLISHIPVRDPSEFWEWSEEGNAWAAPPREVISTKQVTRPLVKWAPPSAEYQQQAQTDTLTEQTRVGVWETRRMSAALSARGVDELLRRVDELTDAIRTARTEANQTEAPERAIGDDLLAWLFEGYDEHPQ